MNISAKLTLTLLLMSALQVTHAHQEEADQSIGQQIDSALQTMKEFSTENKNHAIKEVDSALTRLDERIEVIEEKMNSKWQDMDSNARIEAQKSLQVLRKNREQVANWMTQLKASSSDTFSDLKNSASKAFNKLQNSWENAEEEVEPKKDTPKGMSI